LKKEKLLLLLVKQAQENQLFRFSGSFILMLVLEEILIDDVPIKKLKSQQPQK